MSMLATREIAGLSVPASRNGLALPDGMDFDEWAELGRGLSAVYGSSAWWLGDWVNYGFWEYGQKYEEAIAATGLEYQTLRKYASIAERFDLLRRRNNLSFGHHESVAPLEQPHQEAWLDRAEQDGLSVMALRQALQDAREIDPPAKTTVTLEQIRFTVPPDRAERWKVAAEKAGQDFSEWAAGVLDEAAA